MRCFICFKTIDKVILILLSLAIILSGCEFTPNKEMINEKDFSPDYASNNPQDVVRRIYDINNGMAPKIKPTGKKTESETKTGTIQDSQQLNSPPEKKILLENLSLQYSKALITTNIGEITMGFYATDSPVTVNNFLNLAKNGFFDGIKFHMIQKGSMIQTGDPNSKDNDPENDGAGGPSYRFQDEINSHKLLRGSIAMANTGKNTNGSQFFIVTATSTPWLDGKNTNFGYVIDGFATIDLIENTKTDENGRPLSDIVISKIELIK
jgi:cyclophilin family peptidyl-prolyl cis-trans isomerase